MTRQVKLKGIPAELRTVAVSMPRPQEIARHLDKLPNILALPRFKRSSDEPATDLEIATELVDAIRAELEQMKRALDEAELQERDRKWHKDLIDGTYALTLEWQEAGRLTERREKLLDKKPAPKESKESMRNYIDGAERKIHEELADLLSRNPRLRQGILILEDARELAWDICMAVSSPGGETIEKAYENENLKSLLLDFMQEIDAILIARELVFQLVVELERQGALDEPYQVLTKNGVTSNNIEQNIFAHDWPPIDERGGSLLRSALKNSDGELDPFLEYLEARGRGRSVIADWCKWAVTTKVAMICSAYSTALHLLRDGQGSVLLDEIEETGELDSKRFDEGWEYLCHIGAVLRKTWDDETTPDNEPAYLYRLPADRKQGVVPDGWVIVPSREQLEKEDLDEYVDSGYSIGLGNFDDSNP